MSVSVFSQGPWTQNKGKIYSQVSYSTIPNYDALFGDPDYNSEREITDNTLQFYGEYGLLDKTTLIVNLPLKMIKTGVLTDFLATGSEITTDGFEISLGNVEFSLKHNFYNKKWLLSGQLSLEANTGSFYENSGIRTGYDAWSFKPFFLAGRSFQKSYLQTSIGTCLRTNNYSSSVKVGGEYGRKITKSIWLVGFLDIEKSFKNGDVVLPTSNLVTGLYVNNQEYGVVGVKVIGEFSNDFGITASLPAAFFGNNVAKQMAFSFGVYKKF